MIPPSVQHHIDRYFGTCTVWTAQHAGGTRHLHFRSQIAGQHWVLRLAPAWDPPPGVDPHREARLVRRLQHLPWMVEVVLVDPDLGLMLMRDAGPVLSHCNAVHRAAISAAVCELHSIPGATERIEYLPLFDRYREQFQDRENLRLVDQAEALLAGLPKLGSCLVHQDLHKGNLCWAGQLKILDWEYAGVGNPWIDYASLVRSLDFSIAELRCLPRLAALNPDELRQGLFQAIKFVDLLELIWVNYLKMHNEIGKGC